MAGNIQRRPDGKWRARYRDANHREHAPHFSRRRDAEQWLASQEVAIARGEWAAGSGDGARPRNDVSAFLGVPVGTLNQWRYGPQAVRHNRFQRGRAMRVLICPTRRCN
jgi:hypothetical protein